MRRCVEFLGGYARIVTGTSRRLHPHVLGSWRYVKCRGCANSPSKTSLVRDESFDYCVMVKTFELVVL